MTAAFSSQMSYATQYQARLDDIVDATMRNRVLLMMMAANGRILPPIGGGFLEWSVNMRNPRPTPWDGVGTPNYSQNDSKRTARLDWASYHFGHEITRHDWQKNTGKTQIINLYEDSLKQVEDSFSQRWPEYFYQDGDTPFNAGDNKPMAGFYTWFNKYIASAAAANQGYQGKVRLASGSYADLVMDLGDESSDWQGDDGFDTVQTTNASKGVTAGEHWWPHGKGDAAYDYWQPLIINTSTAKWGASPGFNTTYAFKQLDFGLHYAKRTAKGDKGQVNLLICGSNAILVIQEKCENKYRTIAQIIPNDPLGGGEGWRTGQGEAYGRPVYYYSNCYIVDDFDMQESSDIIGINIKRVAYQPVTPFGGTSSRLPIMEMYEADKEGGGGMILGGFTYGQMYVDTPRGTVLWKELGD